jgi:subtilisin family serine protease
MEESKQENRPKADAKGCGVVLLVVFVSLWIIVLSGIDLFANWALEQTLFESSSGMADIRWVIHAVYAGLIFIPTLILNLTVKTPRLKLIFRLWMMASILAILTIPLKMLYLTAQNETAILQISSMGMLLIGLVAFKNPNKEQPPSNKPKSTLLGIAGILAFGLSIPWLLWGALGSVIDTLLEIGVGIVFGLLVVKLLYPQYLERVHTEERELRVSDLILDGFVIFVMLLILVAALAHNGSQSMLVISVPISGWVLAGLSIAGIGRRNLGRKAVFLVATFVIALPLLFFDMDELSLIIGSGDGEVLFWAYRAAWFTFMSLLTLIIVIMLNFRFLKNINLPGKWNFGLLMASIVSFVMVYAFWGQIGFHGEKVFVILKSQGDLNSIENIKDQSLKRQGVYRQLTEYADANQTELRSTLDKFNIKYTPYYLVNGIEVDAGRLVKILLTQNDTVDRILDSPQLRPLPQANSAGDPDTQTIPETPTWNIQMIHADQVVKELKITGRGIIIGQTDSGVDARHPELVNNYRGAETSDTYNWYDPWNGSPFPVDLSGHGTMTLGIAAGKNIGVAPDAQWIGCVNLARNLGNPAKYLDCMQFMLAPFPQGGDPFRDGDPSMGANIVNNSWGCPEVEGCDAAVYDDAMKALTTAGIFMSSAAGNTGNYGCASVTDPIAIYGTVFTSGAVNQQGNLSTFSSFGPVVVDGSQRQKPDILAPGEMVTSSSPSGGYSTADGTSFAAPHVTGVVALMWSANPALIGDVESTMKILRETAQNYIGTPPVCGEVNQAVGAGILDAYAAVQAAINWK